MTSLVPVHMDGALLIRNSSDVLDRNDKENYMSTTLSLKWWDIHDVNCSLLIKQVQKGALTTIADGAEEAALHLEWPIYEIFLPILITTGVLANILDHIVLSRPSMQGASYRYLARLALTDLLYLLFNIPFCLRDFLFVMTNKPVSRPSAIYYSHLAIPVVNAFLTMSIYIVVWLSYDRFIAVCRPHKFSAQQSIEVVQVRFWVSLLLTLIVYIPSPFKRSFECGTRGCCVFDSNYVSNDWFITYELIREIYSRFLPAVAITGFNMAIIWTLRRKTKIRRERQHPPDMAREERERRLVILLLAITVIFYVSTFPSALYKIIQKHTLTYFPLFRAVADILEVSGHVFNFVMYFLLSPEFRKTLVSLSTQTKNNGLVMTSNVAQP